MIDQAEAYYAFLDRNGVVLNLGRTRRIATRGQSAALIARDRGCSFPGCDRAPEWSERHHVIPWIDGGPTDLNNLTLLCVYHHHNFHYPRLDLPDQPRRPSRMATTPIRRPRPETVDQHPHHRNPRRPNTPTAVAQQPHSRHVLDLLAGKRLWPTDCRPQFLSWPPV